MKHDTQRQTTLRGRTLRGLLCLILLLIAGACADHSPAGAAAPGEAAPAESRFALLTLNAATGHNPRPGGNEQVEVTGQFVAYTGPDSAWAMGVLDLWLPDEARMRELDRCSLDATPLAAGPVGGLEAGHSEHIELLEAGHLSLDGVETRTLEARYVPDLMDYFTGVVYRLREGEPVAYEPGGVYRMVGTGTEGVGGFDVALSAPWPMELEAINERPYGPALDVALPTDRDLLLEWREPPQETVSERVYFDLYHDDLSPAPVLSCTAHDDGRFALPQDALAMLRARYPEATFRLIARRAEVTRFPVEGMGWARAVFITSDVLFLTP